MQCSPAYILYLIFCPIKLLLPLKPKERLDRIAKWAQECSRRVIKNWPNQQYTVMRNKEDQRPYGLKSVVKLSDIQKIRRIQGVENIWVEKIYGLTKVHEPKDFSIYGVKTRESVVIEGQNKGLQSYIENILAVKARSVAEAKRLAKRHYRHSREPYTNDRGELVWWRFEGIIDVCESWDWKFGNGVVEVYYDWKSRRIKKK